MRTPWIRHFSPAWFAAVMGTGGVAVVLNAWGQSIPWISKLAVAFAALTAVLFVVLLVPWLWRWIGHFDAARSDLNHPLLGNFYVTMPVAAMIVALDADVTAGSWLGPSALYVITLVGWLVGVVGVAVLSVYVGFTLMRQDGPSPALINFSWLLTPVAAIVIPLLGDPLTLMLLGRHSAWAGTVHLVNLAFYGMGLLLFVLMASFVIGRLLQHSLPGAEAAPTFWISLGPIGVGTLGLMGLADVSRSMHLIAATGTLDLLALALWGFGIWAIGIAIAVMLHHLWRGGIPFSLSFWAFTFPLAAYALSTMHIAAYLRSPGIVWYAALLSILLLAFWLWAAAGTLAGLFNGKLFAAPFRQNTARVREAAKNG
ncbi:MAG: C4-dicarboxylate ABC transporter [Thermaerobacter sp.]|nr:C4-dicarboxylate ABC transporter [Thermaerobacter sp.]